MITTKTVLVLGAGASAPYGFPTGANLADHCITAIEPEDRTTLEAAGVESKEVDRFGSEVRGAQAPSIDAFLELRPEFLDVGKLVLASIFLRAEYRSLSQDKFNLSKGDHWYRIAKAKMKSSFEEFGQNKLKIITFNYDRSLEDYLCRTLCSTYGKSSDECAIQLAQIEPLHVYGSLGPLPWQRNAESVPYGVARITRNMILKASQKIQVMHEESEDVVKRNFEKAKEWLQWADRILFLGFGFHEDNVKRLALGKVLQGSKEVIATCKKLDAPIRQRVEFCTLAAGPHPSGSYPSSITFPDPQADCYTLLTDHVDLSS